MSLLPALILAALLLVAAAYAQQQIPVYTAGARKTLLTRGILLAVGIASGVVSAVIYGDGAIMAALAFAGGFGAVHVPAAFILLIKRARRSGAS